MYMRNYKMFLGFLLRMALLIPIIFMASCGSEDVADLLDDDSQQNSTDNSSNPGNQPSSPADIAAITDTQAKSTATTLISKNLNTSISAIDDVTSNSTAVNTIAKSLGLDLSAINATTSAVRATRDDSSTAAIEQQIIDALDAMIDNGIRDGATITFDPDEETLCNDALLGLVPDLVEQAGALIDEEDLDTSDAIDACVDMYEEVTVVLTILGDESGSLAIKMYNFTLLTIGYSTDESYAEFDLAQLKSIIEAIGDDQFPPEDPELPSTFEGVIRLTNSVLGTDHAKMRLSFEESINIVDDSDDSKTSILLSKTDKVIELEANGNDNTASAEIALAAIEALFPIDDVNEVEQEAELFINGLTLRADLTSGGDQLVVTNISLGSSPMLFNIVDLSSFIITDDPKDMELTMESFGFNIDGTEETITFSSLFNAVLAIDDRFGIITDTDFFRGELEVSISDNTVLVPKQNSDGTPVFEVTNGIVNQDGEGDFGFGGSFTQGQCFTLNFAAVLSPDLPFTSESCF